MKLARLNEAGLLEFDNYLVLARSEPGRLPPIDLLNESEHSEPLSPGIEIVLPRISTRMELAVFLDDVISKAALNESEKDSGLWAWLTLLLFDTVCPKNSKSGERKLRERAAYIPELNNFRRYYRHLLLGPYLIYRAHKQNPGRAMGLLCKAPHIIDDIVAQIASRQEYVTNPAVVDLVTSLYFDPRAGTTKRGAGGKGDGSPRRLAEILDQFDVTWDLYAMSTSEFLGVLPPEFGKFMRTGDQAST